jgi:hypothetical protein
MNDPDISHTYLRVNNPLSYENPEFYKGTKSQLIVPKKATDNE